MVVSYNRSFKTKYSDNSISFVTLIVDYHIEAQKYVVC